MMEPLKPLSEKNIAELEMLWKKGVGNDLEKAIETFSKLTELTKMLNNIPNMQILTMEVPYFSVGRYTTFQPVTILMFCNLSKALPKIPEEIRSSFLDVVHKVNSFLFVHKITIGWKNSMNTEDLIVPKDDRDHIVISSCPMLKIEGCLN